MSKSKNMLVIISTKTNWDMGMLNFEIEKAIDYYELPIIVAYSGYKSILNPGSHADKWPKALHERIKNKAAKCIHIPFREKAITMAVSQFHIHNTEDKLTSPLHKKVYRNWGYLE
jgi:hypothetical protein